MKQGKTAWHFSNLMITLWKQLLPTMLLIVNDAKRKPEQYGCVLLSLQQRNV